MIGKQTNNEGFGPNKERRVLQNAIYSLAMDLMGAWNIWKKWQHKH
jgi:hypothetical protein